ncbi:hypothetical protein AAFF_G00294940 [Aldrovandia affinis]|uniref:WAP domain-containing protein n=1 Tax=Aldrovandia affinis TaxID=143900 RepID=A0AAD7W1F5_9TELE|nr:hypothetical protein AAFF_G00294940 [Aldrovandia affinis]
MKALVCVCALVLLVLLDCTRATAANSTAPKGGHCPRRLDAVPSKRACACDEDCPGSEKCCVFACGAVCVPPAFSVGPRSGGVCPRRRRGSGMCAEFCTSDSDCPLQEKCCRRSAATTADTLGTPASRPTR